MVADEASDLRLAGRNWVSLQRDVNFAIVVPQITVGRDRTQVNPFAHVGVPQKAFMILVGMARG